MIRHPDHAENLIDLRRIEGQVRGIEKMVMHKRYCVHILTQIHAVIAALARVEDKILEKHFQNCVTAAMHGKSVAERKRKLAEIIQLIKRFRKAP